MNVSEVIRTKRAVRQFQDQPLPDDVVLTILDAGRRAPSSRNSQPWRFIAIRERATLSKLAEINRSAGHLAGSALGVVILTPKPDEKVTIMFDAGQAATYMQLAAWDLGVASCIGSIHGDEPVRKLLGFPDDWHTRIAISFGYPLEPPGPAKHGGRVPLETVVHWERWTEK